MTRTDYCVSGLVGINVFFLFQFLTAFGISNLTAVLDYQMVAGYATVASAVIGLFLIVRNLTRTVTYVSGNVSETSAFIRVYAIETLLVVISFIFLSLSNTVIFYLFNQVI